MPELVVRPVTTADAPILAAIYNHYIRETIVTFEEIEIDAADIAGRIAAVTATYPWLVGEADGAIIGYAYAHRYHERSAYRHSALSSIYLDPRACGKGFGRPLYELLLDGLPQLGIHTVLGGIALPNSASTALHEKLGFRNAGHFSQVGFKFGRWIDVAYLQRQFGPQ